MTANFDDDSSNRAVDKLEGLGLSVYAARTFAALVAFGPATAREVSETVDVPRTRVYDAADELAERDLVTVESSTPRRFHPVSVERAMAVLGTEYERRVDEATAELESISGRDAVLQRDDLWLLTDADAITDRMVTVVDDAESSLLFATTDASPNETVLDAIEAATERGVVARVADESGSVDDREGFAERVRQCDLPWDPSSVDISTLLVVDDAAVVLTVEGDDPLAVWSVGESNNLLVLLRALLTFDR